MTRCPHEWPDWALKQALTVSRAYERERWEDAFPDFMDRHHARDGQTMQAGFPFDGIMLAKLMCESAGSDRRLFMKYLSPAMAEIYGEGWETFKSGEFVEGHAGAGK